MSASAAVIAFSPDSHPAAAPASAGWSNYCPTRLSFVDDLAGGLGAAFKRLGLSRARVCLVSGRAAARQFGYFGALSAALPPDCSLALVERVPSDPPIAEAAALAARLVDERIDAVIALGGGSAIDFAKASLALMEWPGDPETLLRAGGSMVPPRRLPLIALPTTAGTGSETTPYAVLTNRAGRRVFSISERYFPEEGVIVGSFLRSVPPRVIAEVGFDAFTHALEVLWAKRATPVSEGLALHALALLHQHLEPYYHDRGGEAAVRVAEAATIAGLAFGASYTVVCHALSFPIAEHTGLSHGRSCALTIAEVAEFYASVRSPALDRLAAIWGVGGPDQFSSYIRALKLALGQRDRLHDHGIDRAAVPMIARHGNMSMMANSVLPVTTDDAERILFRAL